MALKILAVDNEAEALKLIKETAETMGYEVVTFNTGLEAAGHLKKQKIDGALVSASIPYMDGFVLVQLMRGSPSNSRVPIVMLTDFGDAKTMRKAFEAGVTFFLSKPLDPKRLKGLMTIMRGQMLEERRRYARLPLRTIVQYRAGKNQFKTLSVNVSQRGMLLEPSAGLSVGREVELLFELPNIPGQLNPRATVVRKEANNQMGVRFSSLSPQDEKALSDFISGSVTG
jgi:DNA-binding response OmpR family regulator